MRETNISSINSNHCQKLPSHITFSAWMVPDLSSHGRAVNISESALNIARVESNYTSKWLGLCRNVQFCSIDVK